MKWHWIQQRHNPRLILFFNGWGMDEHVVAHLECDEEWDVLAACDYRDLSKASEVFKTSKACAREIVVVCWSMGVWAYVRVCADLQIHPARVIAINGTPQPIHAEFGIAPEMYQATLDHFDEAGREKFFKRMCGSSAIFERFNRQRPQRSLAEQAEELAAIQAATKDPALIPVGEGMGRPVDIALISTHDRIMPVANQQRYWEGRAQCALLDAPHYPFFLWKRWTDILAIF